MIFAPSTAPASAASTSATYALGTTSIVAPSKGFVTSICSGLSTQRPRRNIFMVDISREFQLLKPIMTSPSFVGNALGGVPQSRDGLSNAARLGPAKERHRGQSLDCPSSERHRGRSLQRGDRTITHI